MSLSTIRLLLIEADPIFRLGMRAICDTVTHLEIAAEVESGKAALRVLREWTVSPFPLDASDQVRVIVLEPSTEDLALAVPSIPTPKPRSRTQPTTKNSDAIAFCQHLKIHYPQFPVLILTASQDPGLLAQLQALGVAGYCPKGVATVELVSALVQVAEGDRPGLPQLFFRLKLQLQPPLGDLIPDLLWENCVSPSAAQDCAKLMRRFKR